jgi:hypothetical protein
VKKTRGLARRMRNSYLRCCAFIAARIVVTPYSGFVLSTHFLSDDILEYNLAFLNSRSKDLRKYEVDNEKSNVIIWCQTNQLNEFSENYLGLIETKFTLITGRDHWSRLEASDSVEKVLSSPYLVRWYSQNQIQENLQIKHFPYGVNLNNAMRILLEGLKLNVMKRLDSIHYPYCTIHESNDTVWQADILSAMLARETIKDKMAPLKQYSEYLKDLRKYKFVVSPAGDRPDTYRHWEILALGGIPISNVPKNFTDMFANSVVIVSSFDNISLENFDDFSPNRNLAKLSYWRKVLLSEQPGEREFRSRM